MTQLIDATQGLINIRQIVQESADPALMYSFEPYSGRDYSGNLATSLFEQNLDFMVFDAALDDVRRAGPSKVSPGRNYGTIMLSLYTKDDADDLGHQRALGVFSDWFAEKTVKDIRFRSFIPMGTSRVMGFLCFTGVLSFEFETLPKDMTL